MRDRAVETLRIVLTVLGFALLIIFGSRAARQADDMKLAGATHHSLFAAANSLHAVLAVGSPVFTNIVAQHALQQHSQSPSSPLKPESVAATDTHGPATAENKNPVTHQQISKPDKEDHSLTQPKVQTTSSVPTISPPPTFVEPTLPKALSDPSNQMYAL
jgi:hypothetical protein